MNVDWFEMKDLIKRDFNRTSWIPICSSEKLHEKGEFGKMGYLEEYFRSTSILIDVGKKDAVLQCNWGDFNSTRDNSPYVTDHGRYKEAGIFENYKGDLTGIFLVLQQTFETGDAPEWHLHQDIVLALKLIRKEDAWVAPEEDYIQVARIKRDQEGKPVLLEIRSEHLKDYLCARNCGLLVSSYHSRGEISKSFDDITWPNGESKSIHKTYEWRGYLREIHEGGLPFGGEIAIMHASRTDVDNKEDLPIFDFPKESEMLSKQWTVSSKGEKLIFAHGELWKQDWIAPATTSARVRGDQIESKIPFIIDNEGRTAYGENLDKGIRWLWFKPTIINSILKKPKAKLNWFTEDTGGVGTARFRTVHFGMNQVGLINVLAKDIAFLSEADKKIWVAHNVTPEGGVSRELLQSQMEAKPARTTAPEVLLYRNLGSFQMSFLNKFGQPIFKEHSLQDEILLRINRFLASEENGLFLLAKEIYRFAIERIDGDLLRKIRPQEKDNPGSIKRIARLLNEVNGNGEKITAPLAGLNDLRIADAHLPPSDLSKALTLTGLTGSEIPTIMGKKLISNIAEAFYEISRCINQLT